LAISPTRSQIKSAFIEESQNIFQHHTIRGKADRTVRFAGNTNNPGVFQKWFLFILNERGLNNDPDIRSERLKIPPDAGDKYLDILVVHAAQSSMSN
jgi:hypothetical protein